MPCNYIDLGDGAYAHVNGDMSDPETAKEIQAVCAAALKMIQDKESENDDRATARRTS
jgi:hypothetical protein